MRQVSFLFLYVFLLCNLCFAQGVTLEYIFQEPQIINPRPTLKAINTKFNKIYFHADPDFDNRIELYDYNLSTGQTAQVSDSTSNYSEFVLLENGDAVTVIDGDIFISKDFCETNKFTKDVQLINTNEYEYSPRVIGNLLLYRRAGNYFLKLLDQPKVKELQLTKDESDTVSYFILSTALNPEEKDYIARFCLVRLEYKNRDTYLIPDYNNEYVRMEKLKKGVPEETIIECEILASVKDSLKIKSTIISYPSPLIYKTSYADYSPDHLSLLLDAETHERNIRKLFIYNIADKTIKEIYKEEYQNGWFERHDNRTEFIDNETIFFESEIKGYNNIFSIKKDGTGFNHVCGLDYTVNESIYDAANKKIYFIANKEHPCEWNIYEQSFNDMLPIRITKESGGYEGIWLSSDRKKLFYSHSKVNKPDELYYTDIETGTETQITQSISPLFTNIDWNIPEIISFQNNEDGQTVYANLYKPKDYNPKKKYPLLCFAHGQGYLQEVTMGFPLYRDNFMLATYLTQLGYIVLNVDFRGSMGYGAEFRNKTYKNMGQWEVSDYVSAVNYLDKLGMIDRNKVGIYGGSYGGFITLMALFKHPDIFKAGVAFRAPTDWVKYYPINRWFSEARFGDYTDENKKIMLDCSPITYTQDLQVPLLLIHGLVDDNVHFQQMTLLMQKLIDNKKDFEVMFYPKENHSFRFQSSWLDEHRRMVNFFKKWF